MKQSAFCGFCDFWKGGEMAGVWIKKQIPRKLSALWMHTFITLQPKFQNCKISPATPPPLGLLQNLPPTPECRLGSVFVCPGWLPVITLYPTTLSQPLTFMSNLSAQNSNVPMLQMFNPGRQIFPKNPACQLCISSLHIQPTQIQMFPYVPEAQAKSRQ